MKLLAAIAIACFGVTWALPAPPETQAESQAQDLLYAPCSNALVFNSAYCCTRGALGTVSDCISPILPINDEAFDGQCKLFSKEAVCCLSVLPDVSSSEQWSTLAN
ncbi:hypothetical protein F5Y08DRAFT_336966 [Xylaria arbuscula]|nr:hypothetical protein F5Y08DRAFT_336966 [Xylaria arbuscula]